MKEYRINEIFYSLQGEGRNTGQAAVFIRFSGCNLHCSFCDTDFTEYTLMTLDDIVRHLADFPSPKSTGVALWCILTGGEPSLQADDELVGRLHQLGYRVAMESNGTHQPPAGLDWLTVSPKVQPIVEQCSELKVVFDGKEPPRGFGIKAQYYYLQPCDTGDREQNQHIVHQCIEYIKQHPRWQLSLQTHKMVGIE
ncbi:MAG: radical SAM protein [Prevotella sp.]|nr:radical SAM protein [Prevotella sp.]